MRSPVFLTLHIRHMTMLMHTGYGIMIMPMGMGDDMCMYSTAMHMNNGMQMLVTVVLDHGIAHDQNAARHHAQQSQEIRRRKLFAIHKKGQKCSDKRCHGIVRTRLCRPQISLCPDVQENT